MIGRLDPDRPLTLCSFSMSGHIALRLLADYGNRIGTLILFAPAVYDKQAFTARFGTEFSNIIRIHDSWRKSDVYAYLAEFRGKILFVTGENDEVIPYGVLDSLIAAATKASKVEAMCLPGVPHQVGLWLQQDSTRARWMASRIAGFADAHY